MWGAVMLSIDIKAKVDDYAAGVIASDCAQSVLIEGCSKLGLT